VSGVNVSIKFVFNSDVGLGSAARQTPHPLGYILEEYYIKIRTFSKY
jgi:hypothetical protein